MPPARVSALAGRGRDRLRCHRLGRRLTGSGARDRLRAGCDRLRRRGRLWRRRRHDGLRSGLRARTGLGPGARTDVLVLVLVDHRLGQRPPPARAPPARSPPARPRRPTRSRPPDGRRPRRRGSAAPPTSSSDMWIGSVSSALVSVPVAVSFRSSSISSRSRSSARCARPGSRACSRCPSPPGRGSSARGRSRASRPRAPRARRQQAQRDRQPVVDAVRHVLLAQLTAQPLGLAGRDVERLRGVAAPGCSAGRSRSARRSPRSSLQSPAARANEMNCRVRPSAFSRSGG